MADQVKNKSSLFDQLISDTNMRAQYAIDPRPQVVEQDPDFAEYAIIWRQLEYIRSYWRRQYIPTRGTHIPWIADQKRAIQRGTLDLLNKYARAEWPLLEGNTLEEIRQSMWKHWADKMEQTDVDTLQDMLTSEARLLEKEEELLQTWKEIEIVINALLNNRYHQRMTHGASEEARREAILSLFPKKKEKVYKV